MKSYTINVRVELWHSMPWPTFWGLKMVVSGFRTIYFSVQRLSHVKIVKNQVFLSNHISKWSESYCYFIFWGYKVYRLYRVYDISKKTLHFRLTKAILMSKCWKLITDSIWYFFSNCIYYTVYSIMYSIQHT